MKILLFAPPFETPAKGVASYPLSLIYLGTILEKKGHDIRTFDFLFDEWDSIKNEISDIIKKENPNIIGISAMTSNRVSAFKLAILAKEINPQIKIIMGGVHPSLMYEQIMKNFPVDFIVIGEGEITIAELIDYISRKNKSLKKLKDIDGIVFKYKNKIVKTNPRRPIENLDSIPFPKHEYFAKKINSTGIVYITTSRGCPFGCNFCSTTIHWGRRKRQRSVKNVISEIKEVKKKFPNVHSIYFDDDEFITNNEWVVEFCKAFLKNKINLKWECAGRVSSVSEKVIKAVKSAGCQKIYFGVESGSLKILQSIRKNITPEQVINAHNLCEKYKLPAGMYFMIGLPGEDSSTIRETINLLKKIPHAELGFPAIFQLFPGTETYDIAKKQGFISDDYWLSEKSAPFYTYENSKKKLVFWAIKVAFFNKLYRKELWSFIKFNIKYQLKYDKLKRLIKRYL